MLPKGSNFGGLSLSTLLWGIMNELIQQALGEFVVTDESRLTKKFTLEILADTIEVYNPAFCEFVLVTKWIRYAKWN